MFYASQFTHTWGWRLVAEVRIFWTHATWIRHHFILSRDCKMSAYARHVDGKERRDRRIWWDVGTVWNGCLQMRYSFEFMYPDFFDAGSHTSHCRCDMLWPFDLWHVTVRTVNQGLPSSNILQDITTYHMCHSWTTCYICYLLNLKTATTRESKAVSC